MSTLQQQKSKDTRKILKETREEWHIVYREKQFK